MEGNNLPDESDHDAITTATHICIIIQFPLTKWFIALFLKTIWYHMGGCANHYRCASDIYLLSYLSLKFYIIIDGEFGIPGHVKDFVDGLNNIYKRILRLAMEKLLNPEWIQDVPNVFHVM